MIVGMGLIKNEHGVWCARKKVPARLQQAVAKVLGKGKTKQTWLKQSLRTKDRGEAKRAAHDVLKGFDETLRRATALIAPRPTPPLRSTLSGDEITRLGQLLFARMLADDERLRFGGRPFFEALSEKVHAYWREEGREPLPPFAPVDSLPMFGMSPELLQAMREDIIDALETMQEALALGDISAVEDDVAILLDEQEIALDPNSAAYRELGTTALRQYVRALQAIAQRNAGEPIETPKLPMVKPSNPSVGGTLRQALAGWKKDRDRSQGTVGETQRAIDMFIQLHGDMPVAEITRAHARTFREALRDVPWPRPGELAKAMLPQLVEWRREHPGSPTISRKTVNKQFGAVQAIVNWARENGMIPDERWADPFSKMRVSDQIIILPPWTFPGATAENLHNRRPSAFLLKRKSYSITRPLLHDRSRTLY